jgi:hypothetical protein
MLLRSSGGRGRLLGLLGRNGSGTAAGRWRGRERFVAADAVVVPCRVDPAAVPLVPVRSVGVLLSIAHSEATETPCPTRAVVPRQLRLVRVWRISAGNRSGRRNRRSTAQRRDAKADKAHFHLGPLFTVLDPLRAFCRRRYRQCYRASCRRFRRVRCGCPWCGGSTRRLRIVDGVRSRARQPAGHAETAG